MKTDTNKGITAISYNHLNLPDEITINGQSIKYFYDATGIKQSKIVNNLTTDYAGGFIYEGGQLKFFSHPEGYVSYNLGNFDYIYQYNDHLGNVRLSYDKNLVIQEENNYYPFGLKHKGYNAVTNLTKGNIAAQKYKYNGKELQDELGFNFYDYGARNYDPALGRWMNIDPLAENSRRFSPYVYALNNPVFFIDPDGMEATPPTDYVDQNGNLLLHTNDGSNAVITVPENKEALFIQSVESSKYSKSGVDSKSWNFTMKDFLVGKWNQGMENTQSWFTTAEARRDVALYWQTGNMDYWSDATYRHTATFRKDILGWATSIAGGILGLYSNLPSSTITSSTSNKMNLSLMGRDEIIDFVSSNGGRNITWKDLNRTSGIGGYQVNFDGVSGANIIKVHYGQGTHKAPYIEVSGSAGTIKFINSKYKDIYVTRGEKSNYIYYTNKQ